MLPTCLLRAAGWLSLSFVLACVDEPSPHGAERLPDTARDAAAAQQDDGASRARADAGRASPAAGDANAAQATTRDAAARDARVVAGDAARDSGPDATRADAAIDPVETMPCSGSDVCDDFEEGSVPDSARWKVLTSYSGQPSDKNRIVLDTQHVARGKQALHVHTETNDPVYIETVRLPLASNGFYGRVFAYFAADPGARSKGHWGSFVGVGKKAGGGQDVEVRIGGQFDILVANYAPNDALQTSASRDGFYDDGARLPIATWACFEFQFDGAGNELHVWLDGKELERLHVTDWNQFGHGLTPSWSPSYDRLRIGYQSWNADTPIDVWYDAVAVSTQRVGCEE